MGDVDVTSVADVTGWAQEQEGRKGEREEEECLSEKLLQEEEEERV